MIPQTHRVFHYPSQVYPLIPDTFTPSINDRWKNANKTAVGIILMAAPVRIIFQSVFLDEEKLAIPVDITQYSSLVLTISGHR